MNRIKILMALLSFLITTNLYSGSILSSFGLGEPAVNYNTRSMALGFVSVSSDNPFYINPLNPAALYRIRTTMISVQYVFANNRYSDPSGSAVSNYSNVNGFAFALPLSKLFGLAVTFSPLTRVDYKMGVTDSNEGKEYSQYVEGSGGMNTFNFAAYFAPVSNLSIGFSAFFAFGRIDETWNVEYTDPDFSSTKDLFLSRNNGYGFIGGILYRPVKNVALGISYSPEIKIDSNTGTSYKFKTDKYTSTSEHILPEWFKSGVSVTVAKKLSLNAEYGFTRYSRFQLNSIKLSNTIDVKSISLGVEFLPGIKPADPYFKKISYRAGFCTKPYFYLSPNGNKINETWFTLGFGFPMYGGSTIDLAVNYGIRGNLETNSLKENIFKIGLSVTAGEKWFKRRY